MAIHSRGHRETVSSMKSVKPNSRSRVKPPRAHDLSQTLQCVSASLQPKNCHNSAQFFFVFIIRLYFSADNQKHQNMIIGCYCTVRGKNSSVLTVNSAVNLLI